MYNDTGVVVLVAMGWIFQAFGWAMLIVRICTGADLSCTPAFVAAIVFFVAAIGKYAISVGDRP
jgi:hypothetical protein